MIKQFNLHVSAAALGDLQCSVLATLRNPDDAVLNISTSAQLAFVATGFDTDQVDCEY